MLCKTKKKNTFVAEIACRSHFYLEISYMSRKCKKEGRF